MAEMRGMGEAKMLGIDPGVTTGLAVFYPHRFTKIASGMGTHDRGYAWERHELGPDPHHRELWNFLAGENWHSIVCESFEFRQGTANRTGLRLDSVEYIGVVKTYVALRSVRANQAVNLQMQTAGMMKGGPFGPKPRDRDALRRLGLHTTYGPDYPEHMNDATRHLLHYMVTKLHWNELIRELKPV